MTDELDNPFPGTREYLGTIRTADGREYKIFMPNVADVCDLDSLQKNFMYHLSAKSIGIPYSEFQTWGLLDALLVGSKLSTAVDALTSIGAKK